MSVSEEELTAEPEEVPVVVAAEPQISSQPARPRISGIGETGTFLLLLLVLLAGAYFRFTGLAWDETHHLHPDERFLTSVANKLQPTYNPLTYLKTSESPLNPYNVNEPFYVYGNFPMTATRLIAELVQKACGNFSDPCDYNYTAYDGVHLVGRALAGLVDLLTVLFTFFIGRRLYGWRAGLVAAALYALAVMPIQQSHFFTMDTWAVALTVVTMYTAVRASEVHENERGQTLWWGLFGLCLGLTVACRINMAPLAAMAPVAAIIWLAGRSQILNGSTIQYLTTPRGSVDVQRAVLGVMLAAVVSILTFRVAQPYAFADSAIVRESVFAETGQEPGIVTVVLKSLVGFNPQWRNNMAEIQRLQSPEASFPPALQWTDRPAILFPLTNMVLYGMGLTAGIFAWLAFLWAFWRIIRARPDWQVHALPVAWIGLYFLFMGTRWVKSVRYFLPIYPFLFLLAGWGLFALWQRASAQPQRSGIKRAAVAALAALVIVPSLLWANAFVEIYRQPVTRLAASAWMFENIPTGATLLYEADGESKELQLPLRGYEFMNGGLPLNMNFTLPEDGTVTAVRFNYLSDANIDFDETSDEEQLQVRLLDVVTGQNLGETTVRLNLEKEKEAVTVDLPDTRVAADQPHAIFADALPGGSITAGTSLIVNEHWDDLLPVNLDGRPAYSSYYAEVTGGQRPVAHPDNEQKRLEMITWLDEADYIAISSQRAIWSVPRLPMTYPMTSRYYEALFNGEMGFELVADFQADFHIGPLYISDTGAELGWGELPDIGWPPPGDLAAEEAFSVYDHPPVWIFKKTADYNHDHALALLNEADLTRAVFMTPGQATQAPPNGLMLTDGLAAAQQANGTFSDIFAVDGVLSRNPALAAVVWWAAVILLGWLAFPIAFVALRGLPDRGYALSRILSLLLISYFGWLMASLRILPNSRGTLLLGMLLIGLVSLLIFLRRRQEMVEFIRQHRSLLGIIELVGIGLYLYFILVRLGNPDVWDVIWGGEKPMDLSYFTAVLKSTYFPPYDPWFAGGYINYYYYGFVYVGSLTKLLGVVPTVAYNLILPMLFSFTGLGAFSLAFNLVAKKEIGDWRLLANLQSPISNLKLPITAGLVATVFCVLLGNLGEVGVMLTTWQRASDSTVNTGVTAVDTLVRTLDGGMDIMFGGRPAPIGTGDWFWTATRAINIREGEVAPITEFPYFTFLYGDLHAHMIALPLALLALGWSVALALEESTVGRNRVRLLIPEIGLQWVVGALAIGVLWATNTWDLPTYLLLGVLAILYQVYRRSGRLSLGLVGEAAGRIVLLVLLVFLAFRPFNQNYGAGYTSLSLWPGTYTFLKNYLVIYGLFLFLVITHLAREFRDWASSWSREGLAQLEPIMRPLLVAILAFVVLLAVLVIKDYWIAPIALTLSVIAGVLSLRPGLASERRVVLLLISCAFALTLFVEIFVLAGDIGRMNTVFKFYMQVWVILSVVGGTAVVWAWPAVSQRWGQTPRRVWQVSLGILVAAALLYPLLATRARWQVRMSKEAPYTLDGMVFMKTTEYGDTSFSGSSATIHLKYDYDALRWMQQNIQGSPIIAEAYSNNPYRSIGARVAMYTGLPTIIGWDWHQRQQRAVLPGTLVSERVADVTTLYNTTDIGEAMRLIAKYDVKYIYAGQLEWVYYNPQGLVKFDQMVDQGLLQEVYRNEGVSIYKVVESQSASLD